MAIAVASVSAQVASNYPTGSVTLTAPTGITTGDLLVIIAGGRGWDTPTGQPLDNYSANSGQATCTGFTQSYYHSRDVNANSGVGGVSRVNVLYKIAVVADQTTPSYVVAHNSSSYGGAAIMFRITGWSTGDPFAHGRTLWMPYIQDGSGTLAYSAGGGAAMSRPSQSVMLMYACTVGDDDRGFYYTNYASTPSETWTEAGDTTFTVYGSDGGALGVAYATTSATTDLTDFSVYKTLDASDGSETTVLGVLPIFTPVSTTGTVARINNTATFFTNAGLSDGLGTVSRINETATFPGASGRGSADTVWTARSKNSTTWTARS